MSKSETIKRNGHTFQITVVGYYVDGSNQISVECLDEGTDYYKEYDEVDITCGLDDELSEWIEDIDREFPAESSGLVTKNVSAIFVHAFADGMPICDWKMRTDCTLDDLKEEAATTKSNGYYFYEYMEFSIYDDEDEFVELVTVWENGECEHKALGDYGTPWEPDTWQTI